MKVLIVDDSKIILDRLNSIVSGINQVEIVGQALNTIEAKTIIKEKIPDVVISDIRMPGGGGLDLLQYIKNKYPGIIVIIITNYPYPQYRERAIDYGAEYFLNKSDELEKLSSILEQINNNGINNG